MNLSMVEPTPVVIWHGLTNDCCHEIEGRDKGIIEKVIPGIYVRSLQIPDPLDLPGMHYAIDSFINLDQDLSDIVKIFGTDEARR